MQQSELDQLNAQNAAAQQQLNTSSAPLPTPQSSTPPPSAASITGAVGNTSTPTVQAPTGNNNENWLTKLLPTAGSILGGIGGALIPGLGETGIGEVGGSGVGSAIGKAIEDAITGQQAGGDVLASGAEGLVGGGIGKLGEGALAAGGKLLAGVGTKGLNAADEAAQAANKLADAQKTNAVFGGVPKAIKEGVNPNQSLQGAQDLSKAIGIDHNDPQQMVNAANTALNPLSDFRKEVVSGSGPINTAGIVDASGNKVAPSLTDIIDSSLHNTNPLTGEAAGQDLSTILGSTDKIAVKKNTLGLPNNASTQFMNQARSILGEDSNSTDPESLLNASIQIGKNAQAAQELAAKTGTNDITGINAAKAQAWNNLDQQVNKLLYERPSVDEAISQTPGNFTAEDVGGNQQLADTLNASLNSASSGKDLNGILSQFMNLKNQGNAALKVAGNPASSGALATAKQEAAQTAGKTVDAEGNPIADVAAATNHPVISTVGKAFNVLNPSVGGVRSAGAVKLGNLLERIAPTAGLAGGDIVANSPNMTGSANANTAVGLNGLVNNIQPTNNVTSMLNSTNPDIQLLGTDLLRAEHPVLGQSSVLGGAGDIQVANRLNRVNTAQDELANLANMLNQSGGAQGPIAGNLSKFASMFTGGPAVNYDQQAEQLVSSLNDILGTHVAAPSISSNQQAANDVLQQLQAALVANGAGA